MKKTFITGLVILLPLALTAIIMIFLVNLLTDPFIEITKSLLHRYGLVDRGFLFLSASQVLQIVSQAFILFSLFFFTVFLGVITRWFFFHYFIRLWDSIIHRIPLISSIYKTCQDVIHTILKSDTSSFKQVVLVPFPTPESHSLGLITRENLPGIRKKSDSNLVAVFVPTTPNPTSGFLILFEEKDITYVDTKIEDALKYIISCGMILNEPINVTTKKSGA